MKLRKEKGLSQNELAQLIGMSESYIRDIEHGRKCPRIKTLELIAAALGVGIEYFVDE